ncbi:diaminopimelate epimerase [Naumannella sp. ID2617S]|uniref:Diaminopimelate epimerase n=1 Tax=Enemella dayhoffiae TaxID=2016507 RepID=A0A255H325_9ACTN|nr:diaminopimelate epimerase [Enemella dayhoffiae]NNG19388.1 diaminopimelate epimerase [Naumannella sp. ID2617S]OYO22041.1 diaminopimelate epimerase [Enemella dayhoffiae]
MRSWSVAKGHGTENDFVIIVDRHGMLAPSDGDVRFLCDRRAGIGGDGLLRAIKAQHIPEWDGDPDLWFMDYRNADGSISEMCGNGVRVFARFLNEEGLANDPLIPIGTRAGLRTAHLERDLIRVDMGPVTLDEQTTPIRLGDREWAAIGVDVGNPHAVCEVDDVDTLDLTRAPGFSSERFPRGVNVEFVQRISEHQVRMRVFERGVGETRSCGTGTVAAAAAARHWYGGDSWQVDVLGGQLQIELADQAYLTGPAVVVLRGEVLLPDPPGGDH